VSSCRWLPASTTLPRPGRNHFRSPPPPSLYGGGARETGSRLSTSSSPPLWPSSPVALPCPSRSVAGSACSPAVLVKCKEYVKRASDGRGRPAQNSLSRLTLLYRGIGSPGGPFRLDCRKLKDHESTSAQKRLERQAGQDAAAMILQTSSPLASCTCAFVIHSIPDATLGACRR